MWKKIKKTYKFLCEKERDQKCFFYFNKVMIELLYKKTYFNTEKLNPCLLSMIISLLQEFKKVLPEKILSVLHQ